MGAISTFAQQTQVANKAWFIGKGKNKSLVIDGTKYNQISPSLFVNGSDTIIKLQSPVPLSNPIKYSGLAFVIRLKEGLHFRGTECDSWQWVDIYRPKKFVPKEAPQKEIIEVECDVETTKSLIDTFYIDTSKIIYVGPIDTGLLVFKGWGGLAVKSPLEGVIGFLAQIANGQKVQVDSATATVRVNNFRHEVGVEGGLFRSRKQYNLDCDTCYVWGPEQYAFQAWVDMFFRTKFGAKKEFQKNGLNAFVFLEARYRMFGPVNEIPVTKTISRASLQLGGELEYGPITFQAMVIETLGVGLHGGVSLTWRFLYKDPKKAPAGGYSPFAFMKRK